MAADLARLIEGEFASAPRVRAERERPLLRTRLPDSIPLVGVGGILSGADAVKKFAAGASLVQVYSGLIYRGPELIGDCVEAIRRRREAPSRGNVPNL